MEELYRLLDLLVDEVSISRPADLDKARGICEEHAADFELRADTRATWKRLAAVLREEMGPL